jgi:hypothetical protein
MFICRICVIEVDAKIFNTYWLVKIIVSVEMYKILEIFRNILTALPKMTSINEVGMQP